MSIIITPNRRLAITLRRQYNQFMADDNDTGLPRRVRHWPSPNIQPLTDWLSGLYQSLPHTTARILTAQQALILWQSMIRQHTPLSHYTSEKMLSAWQLCHEHQLDWQAPEFNQNDRTHLFSICATAFQAHCVKHHLISEAALPAAIMEHALEAPSCHTSTEQQCQLTGFLELATNIEALLNALQINWHFDERHHPASAHHDVENTTRPQLTTHFSQHTDTEAQIEAAAHWCAAQLPPEQQDERPASAGVQPIICVWPDIQGLRGKISNVFNRVLENQLIHHTHHGRSAIPLFNISGGIPLSTHPISHIASLLLSLPLTQRTMDFQVCHTLITSPLIGGYSTEQSARHALSYQLREQGRLTYSFTDILTLADDTSSPNTHCPIFVSHCESLGTITSTLPEKNTLAAWCRIFDSLLTTMGWPNAAHQVAIDIHQAWSGVFSELTTISDAIPPMRYQHALDALADSLMRTLYQAHAHSEAPIQILGLLEAVGIDCEALWLADFDTTHWPPAAHPNPYLPLALQQAHQMPHASPDRELRYYTHLIETFRTQTTHIHVSYVQNEESAATRCLLLPATQEVTTNGSTNAHTEPNKVTTEYFIDEYGPAYTEIRVRGGVSLLKHQATCPFQGFAMHRLAAIREPDAHLGLSPADRGILIHSILENFWGRVHDQETLIALTPDQRTDILTEVIHTEISTHFSHRPPGPQQKSILSLESERLNVLLLRYLAAEIKRTPFTVIARETKKTLTLAGVELRLKIDRIDKQIDSTYSLIDYKTSMLSPNTLYSYPLTEPQLPMYAISVDFPVTHLLWIILRSDNIRYHGVSLSPKTFGPQRLKPDEALPTQIADWHTALTQTMTAFKAGDAHVAPVDGGLPCQTCHLQSLCRIQEACP